MAKVRATAIRRKRNVTSNGCCSSRAVVVALILMGCCLLAVVYNHRHWNTTVLPNDPNSTRNSTGRTNALPTHVLQRGVVVLSNEDNDDTTVEFLWQTPTQHQDPRAILFLAHGCGHDQNDWWSSTNNNACRDCRGLPEERAIVRMALEEFHLLVVAVSSRGTCWSVEDGPRVVRVLQSLQRDSKKQLPMYALGASSGGSFVASVLAREKTTAMNFRWSGYIAQIAAPSGDLVKLPAVFITMNRDRHTEQRVRDAVAVLRSDHRVPVQHIRLPPLKLGKDFFAKRIGEEYINHSPAMVDALEANGLLRDGFLTQDPRQSNWRPCLAPLVVHHNDSMVADQSPISEVLNCAWGMHEMTRDGVREALSFLLTNT